MTQNDNKPAAAPIDDARECLMDVVSHHDNIVAGFAAQRLAAEEAQDHDTAAYWKREIDVAHRMKVQAERALVAMAQPVAAPIHPDVLAHIKWLHYCLREEGHCIDGGKCHHECGPKGECWRQDGCVPFTGSRLTDGWKLRAPSAPSPADERIVQLEASVQRYRNMVDELKQRLHDVTHPDAPADERAALSEDRIDWIANAHCPNGTAYPVNMKNAIREALREARIDFDETGADVPRLAFDWQTGFVNEHGYPPDSEDGFAAGYMAALSRSPAMAAEAVGEIVTFVPDLKEVSWRAGKMPEIGTKLYAAPQPAQASILTREEIGEAWREAGSAGVERAIRNASAQADARVGPTDEQILECATRRVPPREVPKIPELAFSRSQFVDVVRALLASHPGQPEPSDTQGWLRDGSLLYRLTDEWHPQNRDEINVTMADGSRDNAGREARAKMLLAFLTGQPEPRTEVTNPFRELLAALIDIYDDERNNAPEDRCYVEGAWSEVLGEARALLAPFPDPAQVSAESPDWIKNALPPEGA